MRPKQLPEFALLKEVYEYLPETGELRTKVRLANRLPAGMVVGSKSQEGYLKTTLKGESYPVHRLIWKLVYGVDPEIIDHIDWNKTNNKIENLRSVSYSQNNTHRKDAKGYSELPNGTLRVTLRGKDVGYYSCHEEAKAAYREAKYELFGI